MATTMKIDAGNVTQAKNVFFVTPSEVEANQADNPRRDEINADILAALETDIRANGQKTACLVRKDPTTHRLKMIDGWNRHAIVSKIAQGDPAVRLLVEILVGVSDEEAYTTAVKANCLRGDYTTSTKANAAKHMKDTFGYDDAKIADVIGCSPTHVSNFWTLLAAPAPIKEAVNNGTITAAAAIDVARAGLTTEQVKTLSDRLRVKKEEQAAAAAAAPTNGTKAPKGGKTTHVKQAKVNEAIRDIKAEAAAEAEAKGETEASKPDSPKNQKRNARALLKALEGRRVKAFPLSMMIHQFLEGAWSDESAANRLTNLLDKYELPDAEYKKA